MAHAGAVEPRQPIGAVDRAEHLLLIGDHRPRSRRRRDSARERSDRPGSAPRGRRTATRSSTWCMVWPTRPNSTTGHTSLMKRASEVPPEVESSGVRPVSSRIAPASSAVSGPGEVTKASPLVLIARSWRSSTRRQLRAQPGLERCGRVAVVEADVEGRARRRRDHVARRIADVDRGDHQPGRLEMGAAGVQGLARQRVEHAQQARDRIVGPLGIGDVALHAANRQMAGHRAAPADLDHLAEALAGWSARRPGRRPAARPAPAARRAAFCVPLTAGPSSSPVIRQLIEPAGRRSPSSRATAATKQAIAPFMSTAPRP